MLFILVLAIVTLLLGIFQFYSSMRNRGSIFSSSLLIIIPLLVVIFSAQSVIKEHNANKAAPAPGSTLMAKSSSSTNLKDNKIETINSESQSAATQIQKENEVTKNLQKAFTNFGDVSFDKNSKTFVVKPSNDENKKAFKQLMDHKDQMKQSGFEDIQNKFIDVSNSIKKNLGNGYSLQLNQPDKDDAMIRVQDGQVSYTVFK